MSDEEFRDLVRQRMDQTTRRVAMIAFVRADPPTPEGVDNNGTVSFLHLPGGKFIVTNYHVWDHFRVEREKDPTYRVVIFGFGLSQELDISEATLVSENRELDLCVLTYPPDEIEVLGKEFYRPTAWPPARVEDGDDVLATGFPGSRRATDERMHPELEMLVPVLHHESALLAFHVEGVSDRQARIRFTNPDPETVMISSRPLTEIRWGGMSGSLVYRLDTIERRFMPCGLLHAAGQGLDATFFATHLDFIKDDGSLTEPRR